MNKPVLVGNSKVSTKGQVTIPEKVRVKYGIKSGDEVYFLEENGKLILTKGPLRISVEFIGEKSQ